MTTCTQYSVPQWSHLVELSPGGRELGEYTIAILGLHSVPHASHATCAGGTVARVYSKLLQ